MTEELNALREFEAYADEEVAKLSIWNLPIRSFLSLVYIGADEQYSGKRFGRKGGAKNEAVGGVMIERMSYVASLLRNSSRDLGADVDDALSVVDAQAMNDMVQVLGYAHLCEIMPSVHRGFFSVKATDAGFALEHPGEEFLKHEENDTLMSEMTLPHNVHRPPFRLDSCVRMVKAWPAIPAEELIGTLKAAFDHYCNSVIEFQLLPNEAYQECFGFSRVEFIRVRAALMAYADFCLGMADAAELLSMRAFTRPRRERLQCEVREWVAPCLSRAHIIGVSASLADVPIEVAECVIELFTINPDAIEESGVGEGFFPPFFRLGDALIFSPHGVKRLMPERNLVYRLVRTDRVKFDNVLSSRLEPALIAEAVQIISAVPGVYLKESVGWSKGEIDLLAYHGPSNSALQIQAKAGVPPQGARMVAQVQSRTLEAASQLERFLCLANDRRDEICSSAFETKLAGISWASGILVRTCLGTEKAWSAIGDFTPLNPMLLRVAVERLLREDLFSFEKLGAAVKDELARFQAVASRGWNNGRLHLFGREIVLPLLDLDLSGILEYRRNANAERVG